ncbi:type II toxin-antitoxin system VapC family toxin [Haloglomus litoreum]|uniref:type II toxin-antitoxin system VapC family toxin n=1 Tax=Haloglomus litoreum TaxID=3034026 RepID=UPI0023E7849D|nr:PIN domain-containing protein [Haloglomus sp. DT116]
MPAALVDTGVLIGAADADDRHHDSASDIIRAIDRGDLPTGRVTNYVVLEALNWIHERKRHATAVDFYTRLTESAGFEIVHCAQKDYHRATDLFETYDTPAFGDATIAAYMDRTGIEYLYTFDREDFGPFDWVTGLETADNPFV